MYPSRERLGAGTNDRHRSVGTAVAKATLRNRRVSKVKPSLLVAAARDLVKTLRDPQLALESLTGLLLTSLDMPDDTS